MTPDELPADMEKRLAEFADWLRPGGTEPCAYTSARIGTDLRALLKAYQERGRALEAAAPVVPAPEGEACPHDAYEADAAGQPVRCVDCGMAIASAASPVVPVGVRERVLDELDKAWLHGQRRTSWRRDESADAIIAALRLTDTGRE
jgi:hypothetical protein